MTNIRNEFKRLVPKLPYRLRRDLVLAGHAAGEDLPGYYAYPSLKESLKRLKLNGFDPRYAIDVGAFRGEWTQLWMALFPKSSVLMIEPQESKAPILSRLCEQYSPSVCLRSVLAGATDGTRHTFHEMEEGSSVYLERSNRSRSASTKETVTIDTLIRDSLHSAVDMLKLDTQGFELEILKGATSTLQRTSFVLLEASLIPINAGCPLISDVMSVMTGKRFRLFDICGQWRRPDHILWQVDLLFVSEQSKFLPRPELTGNAFANWAMDSN
jgi:FkbM family methyltransferase